MKNRNSLCSYLLCSAFVVYGILSPTFGRAQSRLGSMTFPEPSAKALPLDQFQVAPQPSLADSLQSYKFVSSVGGIAFDSIAAGQDGMKAVSVKYSARQPDGRRLLITVQKRGIEKTFPALIYDWQLIPIARFAATDQHACFTMFGRLSDEQEQQDRRARGENILGYHSAFQNTLLGWRLLQADMLIIRPDACDLPTQDRRYLVGSGEQRWLVNGKPNVVANRTAYRRLHDKLSQQPRRFTSYVICDYQHDVTFTIDAQSGTVTLTGMPYWYCWRRKINEADAFQKLQKRANQRANGLLQAEMDKDQKQLPHRQVQVKWTGLYQQQRFSAIFDRIVSAELLQPLPNLSRLISTRVRELNGINPVVYNALLTTMRYTALLRHIRQENPQGYLKFCESLSDLPIQPKVKTPSVMTGPRTSRGQVLRSQ